MKPEDFKIKLRAAGISEEISDYLVGNDSNLEIEKMNREQLEELQRGVRKYDVFQKHEYKKDNGAQYFNYLRTKYNRDSNIDK